MRFDDDFTRPTLDAFFVVFNRLGHGFLERVYVNALTKELRRAGLDVENEVPVDVIYDGDCIGHYRCDLIVGGKLIVEVKSDAVVSSGPERQLLNYLRCSRIEVGLLLSFGIAPRFKRLVCAN